MKAICFAFVIFTFKFFFLVLLQNDNRLYIQNFVCTTKTLHKGLPMSDI